MAREDHDAHWAIAEQISQARPQWLVVWGRFSRRFWGYPLFEMHPRQLVYARDPDALVARLDEAERQYRVWPQSKGGEQW